MEKVAPILDAVDPVLGTGFVPILLLVLVAVAAVWDIRRRRIPNSLLLVVASIGLAASVWLRPLPTALLLSVSGLLVGGVVWLVPYIMRMAGAADLKLVAAIGVWLGPLAVTRISVHAALIGGCMALLWLVWSRGLMGSWVFFTTLSSPVRDEGREGPPSTIVPSTLPFALAILIGVGFEVVGVSLVGGAR